MTPDQIERLLLAVERIADSLDRLASPPDPGKPRHVKPLACFKTFNWRNINASVVRSDQYGAAVVECGGQLYYRRSKPDFGEDIWFSYSLGAGDDGRPQYSVLIKFTSPPKVKSLAQDLVDAL